MTEDPPWSALITAERVFELHRMGIERYGGTADIRTDSSGCVDGAIGNAWSAEAYDPIEGAEQGLAFAAYLLIYLIRRHCFIDGNKRVGWLAMIEIFRTKRLEIDATEEQAEELVGSVIADEVDARDLTFWIAERLQWID